MQRLRNILTFLRPFAFYSMLALAFFIPLHVRMSINLIGVVAVLAIITGRWSGWGQRLRRNWPVLLIWGFWLMHVIGIAYSSEVRHAVNDVVHKLSFVVMPLVFTLVELDERKRYNVASAFVLGCLCSMLIMLGRATVAAAAPESTAVLPHFMYCELTRPFHPTFFAMYLALALAIALHRLYDASQPAKWRKAYAFFVLLLMVFCYLITSRAGIFVMLVALVFVTLVRFKYGRVALIAMGGLGLIAGLVIMVGVLRTGSTDSVVAGLLHHNRLRGYTTDTQQDARLLIWSCVPEALEGHWLLGYGPNCSQPALTAIYEQRGYIGLNSIHHSHNQFFQTGLDIGIVGVLLLIAMLAYPFLMRVGRMHEHTIALVFVAIVLLHFMFDTMLDYIAGIMFFAFFYGLFFCAQGEELSAPKCSRP